MHSWKVLALAFLVGASGLLTGCCTVPAGGCCGNGIAASNNCDACPGLLHGELAMRVRNAITGGCCSGCGELYCDEQINVPPTCDPCCGNGEFAGGNCGPCRPLWQRLCALWGTGYTGCCEADGCASGTCGGDVYATEHSGSGYCPNCRDGVAGQPNHQGSNHSHDTPLPAHPSNSLPTTESIPGMPMNSSTPSLEPIPDPASDAPSSKASSAKTGNTISSRKNSPRTIHVPAVQVKHTPARTVGHATGRTR